METFGNSMKNLHSDSFLVALALAAVFWLAPASADADEMDAIIDRALKASGMAGQVEMLAESVISLIPADALPDARIKMRVNDSVKKAANGKAILATLHASVKEDFDREKIQQVVDFYDAKVGRKVGRLLRATLESESMKQAREGRKTLSAIDEHRLALLKRIIRAENVVETTMRLANEVLCGLLDGSLENPGGRKDSEHEGAKPRDIRTEAWESHIEDLTLVSFALTFRSLDSRELEHLAAFDESDAAAWFRKPVQKGMEKALYQTARALAESVKSPARASSPTN